MRRHRRRRHSDTISRRLGHEARFCGKVLHRLDAAHLAGSIEHPGDLNDLLLDAIAQSATASVAATVYRMEVLIPRLIGHVHHASVALVLEAVSESAMELVSTEAEFRRGFEARLHDRWARPLELLTVLRTWCLEAGVDFHDAHKPAEGDWVYGSLVRLHARGVLIAGEGLALLRAGYPSGAHARWRSAHELAVVAFFVAKHGQETAEMYFLHDAVESWRAVSDYQRYSRQLGYEPFTDSETDTMRRTHDLLVARFGKQYHQQYGWASNALGHSRPSFRDIEADVSLDHLRPYYRMASHSTHAGPKALHFDLGRGESDVMLAGPSNVGLADPGHAIALSLLHLTIALLNHDPDLGSVATMTALTEMCDAVGVAFMEADQALQREISAERTDLQRDG